jgi:hypothetical protein
MNSWLLPLGVGIVLTQACLLAYSTHVHSPTPDEVAYLPGGISHWHFGRFELVRANPPLVRTLAAIPVILAGCKTDWSKFDETPGNRPEHAVGKDFLVANGSRSISLFNLARWACIPFALVGGIICWCWANELYGASAGFAAVGLWSFCPNILGNGALITPEDRTQNNFRDCGRLAA